MQLRFTSIILFVHNTDLLKQFYTTHFSFTVAEETKGEWVLLSNGVFTMGLHKAGVAHLSSTTDANNNCKLVFETTEDLAKLHQQLQQLQITVKPIQNWPGASYSLFDGEDPEGNVFQVRTPHPRPFSNFV